MQRQNSKGIIKIAKLMYDALARRLESIIYPKKGKLAHMAEIETLSSFKAMPGSQNSRSKDLKA